MSKLLFDGNSSDDELELQTNKEYAKSYNKFRQKELLKNCKYTTEFNFEMKKCNLYNVVSHVFL